MPRAGPRRGREARRVVVVRALECDLVDIDLGHGPILTSVKRTGKLAAIVALVLAGTASAAPPREGVLVPGRSLGGVSLGMTSAQVRDAWGSRYGVCRDCEGRTTWYFNRVRFKPEGAGVELRRGRVAAVFTLWKPSGWRTRDGLTLGDPEARITGGLRRADADRVRRLLGPDAAEEQRRHRLLRLRRDAVGLRAHAARRADLPLSDATSGIASRIGIPHSGHSTW